MYKILFRQLALDDIDRAISYLIDKLSNPQAAEDLLNELEGALDQIEQFPYSGTVYRYDMPLKDEIRFTTVKNYVLYYAVADNAVEIRRFLHNRVWRDPGRVLES